MVEICKTANRGGELAVIKEDRIDLKKEDAVIKEVKRLVATQINIEDYKECKKISYELCAGRSVRKPGNMQI